MELRDGFVDNEKYRGATHSVCNLRYKTPT